MPFSSRNFTSEASLKRGGGWVAFPSGRTLDERERLAPA